jgi:hypothetical protein
MQAQAIGRRAILKKDGCADIKVEVQQRERGSFSFAENGVWGAMWPKYTPQQAMSGNTAPMTLESAWESIVSRYPGYSASAVEDAFPEERLA